MADHAKDKLIYKGNRIDLYLKQVPTRQGGTKEVELVTHPGAVVILPMVDANTVCMIENERYSVGGKLLELPAGTLLPKEDTLLAAQRELAEETGYSASQWKLLNTFYPSPGVYGEKMYLYHATELASGTQQLDDTEFLTPRLIPFDHAVEMVLRGDIQDGKSIIGLLLWDKLRRSS